MTRLVGLGGSLSARSQSSTGSVSVLLATTHSSQARKLRFRLLGDAKPKPIAD